MQMNFLKKYIFFFSGNSNQSDSYLAELEQQQEAARETFRWHKKETFRLFKIIGLLLTLNISQASLQIKLAKLEKSSVAKLTAQPLNIESLQAFFAIFLI